MNYIFQMDMYLKEGHNMSIFDFINGMTEYGKKDEKLEKEMDYYNLDEHEKELVRKGEYDPWDFESKEDMEDVNDDDYYGEDDI